MDDQNIFYRRKVRQFRAGQTEDGEYYRLALIGYVHPIAEKAPKKQAELLF